jgi:hypothetical protein
VTALYVPAAGDKPTAAQLNTFVPLSAYKSAGTSRNTTTTPAADSDLTIALPASTTWDFDGLLLVTSAANAAGDFMFQFTYPASATLSFGAWGLHNTLASGSQSDLEAAATSADSSTPSGLYVAGASTSMTGIFFKGRIIVSTTPGNLVVAWSQFASNANNTTLNAGSHMTCRQVA